ncbi:MAG: response regulator [Betaproteobacteria bacterium]|nr:response regulator [Betaproteobacteria bacterium]
MNGKIGKVLCVDDEPHVLRALQWLLQGEFEVHTAVSAQAGLKLLKSHDYDVVVSDQRMPEVSGVEFLQQVRQVAPRAMRILLTGYADLDSMVRSVNESEVFRFISKPWDIKEFPKLIAEAAQIARVDIASPVPPEQQAAAAEIALRHQVTTVALHATESILLVDDNPEVHAAVNQACGDSVQVQHAYNLADAVRMLNRKPAGVIVSDVKVGKLDATRLVRLMKAKHPETVSVVFSDQNDAKVVMTLINEGQVYRFIPKPFKPGFIRIVLNGALKRHRELLDNPGLQRRFAVEPVVRDAAESRLRDVRQAAVTAAPAWPQPVAAAPPAAVVLAAANDGLGSRLSVGWRRLFGG